MKKILTNSGLPGLVNFHYTKSNTGELNIKKNVLTGDVIVVRNDVREYNLQPTTIEFKLNSKTEPTIKDLEPLHNVISNTVCSDFSTYLYNRCNLSSKIRNTEIKWYLPENKIKSWWYEKMIKYGFSPKRDIDLIERHIKDFFKDQPISNKRLIVVPFYIYKMLKQSISFKNVKSKNTDVYYGGKLGEISIWVNNYTTSQSIYMTNEHKFATIMNDNIEWGIVKDIKNYTQVNDIDIEFNLEFINQSDSDEAMITLTDY